MNSVGSGNSWIIELTPGNHRHPIPFDRGVYQIGVNSLHFTKHPVMLYEFAVLCVDFPTTNVSKIYLPEGQTYSSLRSYRIPPPENKSFYIDFSDRVIYHKIDFTAVNMLSIQIRNIHGAPIQTEGVVNLSVM